MCTIKCRITGDPYIQYLDTKEMYASNHKGFETRPSDETTKYNMYKTTVRVTIKHELWHKILNKQEAHRPHCSPEEDFYMFSISFYKLAIISPCRRA